MQRRINIRSAHRLDKSTRDIIVLVTSPANERLVSSSLDTGNRDLTGPVIAGHPRRRLQQRQRLTGIRASQANQPSHGLVCHREAARKPTFIGQRPANETFKRLRLKRTQRQKERARQQRSNHREGRVFRCRRDQHYPSVLHRWKKRILLRLGEAVHLIHKEDCFLATARQCPARAVHDSTHVAHAR